MAEKSLLNICCAPCALPLISASEMTLFFFGPNIFPEDEYLKRFEEVKKISKLYGLPLLDGGHDHADWLNSIKSKLPLPPESYRENEARCLACFDYRLDKTAQFAAKNNFSSFAATLSVSRFKDARHINLYGRQLEGKYNLKYKVFSLDANYAHRVGIELSHKHGIYRQKYCGCEFSL